MNLRIFNKVESRIIRSIIEIGGNNFILVKAQVKTELLDKKEHLCSKNTFF
jgi:hypothetical protein